MIIAIAGDHGGFVLKTALCKHLKKKGFEVLDLGTDSQEARRTARAEQLRYEDSITMRTETAGATEAGDASASTTVVPVVPSTVTTRATVFEALPSWMVHGGVGAWLLLGIFIIIALIV